MEHERRLFALLAMRRDLDEVLEQVHAAERNFDALAERDGWHPSEGQVDRTKFVDIGKDTEAALDALIEAQKKFSKLYGPYAKERDEMRALGLLGPLKPKPN